jgi:hypothetical protein
MFIKIAYLAFSLLLIFALSCENTTRTIEIFHEKAEQIQKHYVPDLSLNVFEAEILREDQHWILRGETTLPEVRQAVIALTDSMLGKDGYQNEFVELPHPSFGDSTYGLVCISVANLRETPRHSAQLVDQDIMGSTLRLLKKDGGWYLIQTAYGYVGWMGSGSFHRTDLQGIEAWKKSDRVRVTELFPLVYSKPDEQSEPVTDVVMNAILLMEGRIGKWAKVSTPDGRTGFIKSEFISKELNPSVPSDKLGSSIVKTARSMMGFPYLWGGNSTKGNDCSGFAQTVFKANGLDILRDAGQQARQGKEIIPDASFSNLLPGDLLFFGFGDRITHVGISLGGAEFIHQSGEVHINSLNPDADNYSDYRRKSLKKIKRYF